MYIFCFLNVRKLYCWWVGGGLLEVDEKIISCLLIIK